MGCSGSVAMLCLSPSFLIYHRAFISATRCDRICSDGVCENIASLALIAGTQPVGLLAVPTERSVLIKLNITLV